LSDAEQQPMVDEQAALRRVATLVAGGAGQEEVFAAVLEEIGQLFAVDLASICRYDPGGTLTWVANWGAAHQYFPVGTVRKLGGGNIGTIVFEIGRSARIDNYAEQSSGPVGIAAREAGINSSLGAPITVEGRLWGVIAAGSQRTRPLPPDTEERLAWFTELAAMAISNTEARAEAAASRARIVAAADDERRRVVRDLHDGAQQRLVHTIITLKLARRALQHGAEDLSALLDEALSQVSGQMSSCASWRTASFRPSSRKAACARA
jgi:GAF domain-containing protein